MKKTKALILIFFLFALIITPIITHSAAEDTSEGSAEIGNDVPSISNPSLTDTSVVNKDGAQIDVDVEYWVKVTVTDNNKLTDLDNVTYIIWGPSSTEGGADSETNHYTFSYTQATDTWNEEGPGSADEHLVMGNCQDPADQQQTSGDFRLAFKLNKIAEHTDTNTWTIKVIAYDDQEASDSDSSLDFGVNFYCEITVDDGTHGWSGLSPNDSDILITSPGDGDIDCIITANANFDMEAKGDDDLGGYHVVWPRDLVEAAGGLLAAGAHEDARRVLCYLQATQEADGHWPQNMWLDGRSYWQGVQMDETAFPILLIDLACREGALDCEDQARFWPMVRQAAAFLVGNGPVTPQDRWEEDAGYSPFTLAVEIAALLAAADLAERNSKPAIATYLRETADAWNDNVERWSYVTGSELAGELGVEGYYVRIAPPEAAEAASPAGGFVPIKNRPPGESTAPADHLVSTPCTPLLGVVG